ncbi:MAG: hypothetical protein HC915_04625 [Anaerolineae bacterium]|nr:hypothetical protein [Anaerolineae bacterium]
MQQISTRLDRSPFLASFFTRFTAYLAPRRGLPLLIGAGLTLVSLVLTLALLVGMVAAGAVEAIWLLMCLPALLLHLAVFISLVGLMLTVPLGASYGE